MKIFSSKSSGKRFVDKRTVDANVTKRDKTDSSSENKNSKGKKKWFFSRLSTRKKIIVIASGVIGLMLIIGACAFAIVRWQIQPFYDYFFKPSIETLATLPPRRPTGSYVQNPDDPDGPLIFIPDTEGEYEIVTRNENKFTFLLMGIDEHANTDAIMIASFDVEEKSLDVVSIPRDTLVNVSWNLKKVNSIHANMRHQHRGEQNIDDLAMSATIEHMRNLLGFHVDFMITVNMVAFVRLIDTIGPISFNVPADVNVDGVRVARGNQRLNGQQALAVMRSRNSYANHAIGRDYAQQEFLMAVADTLIASRNSLNVNDMVNIFNRNVKTNLPLNNLIYFAREFLQLNTDKINFGMMPGAIDFVGRQSYITVLVNEWLEVVNRKLNPFSRDIEYEDLSVLTRNQDRRLYVTDGNWKGDSTWGANSLGPSNPSLTTDSSRPIRYPTN
jgi:LCP family protein required for cell wall assembly